MQAEISADLHRRKDEFLAMLSHELRNPLAPIQNAVHILRLKNDDDPIQQQARTIIERQVGQLTALVNDLLEVSRITTGRIQLHQERIVLQGVVERAVESARPLIEQRRHTLTDVGARGVNLAACRCRSARTDRRQSAQQCREVYERRWSYLAHR